MADDADIQLVYDRQCPVCEFYCQQIDVDASAGTLERVDARNESAIMDEITALGLDIDEGMVVKIGDSVFYGGDAINALALKSSRTGFFNRLAFWTFRSRRVSRLLYPLLKGCRNLLLKLLRRTRINNLQRPDKTRF